MRHRARRQQADGQAAEHQALAPAGVGRNRLAEHAQRVERGSPGDDLGDAQRQHGVGRRVVQETAPGRGSPGLVLRSCISDPRRSPCPTRDTSATSRPGASCPLDARCHQHPIYCVMTEEGPWADQDDQEENRFSARAARYVKVGTNVGAVAARVGEPAAVRPRCRRQQERGGAGGGARRPEGADHEGGAADGHHPRGSAGRIRRAARRSCSRRPRRWGRHSCAGA